MVAARQFPYLRVERAGYRFSKSTKSSDFQTPQMSFFKALKATKKKPVTFGECKLLLLDSKGFFGLRCKEIF